LSRPLLKLAAAASASAALALPAVSPAGQDATRAPVARVPNPIAGLGYHLAFRDEFNHFRKRVWTRKIWYDDRPQSNWKGFQTVEHGVLHLRTGRSYAATCTTCSGDWPINTITTLKSRSFRGGYFEARMRWTKGDGAWPGFWLYSTRHAKNPAWPNINPYCANNGLPKALCYSAEIDVFEGQGSEPRVFYGTVHRNSSGDYGASNPQNGNNYHPQRKNLTKKFHRYAALWTNSKITWYLDGKRLMSAPTYDSTNQPMFLLLQMWVGGWTKDPDASTPDVIQTKVDWVRVWRK
jgi:beta-glucanase (GH16 family)